MNTIRKLAGALLLGAGALGLAGCATGLPNKVSCYQAMPVPAGQNFYVVPAEGVAPSLEFNRYAALVAQHLQTKGYTPAGAPQLASMVVKLDYGVDEGKTEYTRDPFARSRYGWQASSVCLRSGRELRLPIPPISRHPLPAPDG